MSSNLWDRIRPIDEDAVRASYERSDPFPYFCIDNFLRPEFVQAVADSYPDYRVATSMRRAFSALNEHGKVQICDRAEFTDPVVQLDDALRHPLLRPPCRGAFRSILGPRQGFETELNACEKREAGDIAIHG